MDITIPNTDRIKISAANFILIWRKHYSDKKLYEDFYDESDNVPTAVFRNYEILGEINVTDGFLNAINFSNCIIGLMSLSNCRVRNIFFENTEINQFRTFNCNLDGLSFQTSEVKYFLLQGAISGNIYIENKSNIHTFFATNTSSIDYLTIDSSTLFETRIDSNSNCNSIEILNQSIVSYLLVRNKLAMDKIVVSKSTVKFLQIYSQGNRIKSFDIRDDSTIGRIIIGDKSLIEKIAIELSETNEIKIANDSTIGFIDIKNSSSVLLNFFECLIDLVQINSSKISEIRYNFLFSESKRTYINNSTIDLFIVRLDKPYQFTIKNCTIASFELKESIFTKDIFLQISDSSFNSVIIDNFINQGTLVFNNIYPTNTTTVFDTNSDDYTLKEEITKHTFKSIKRESEFVLLNSDLGKTHFIGCNIRSFSKFVFINSKLLDVFVADTALPNKSKIGTMDPLDRSKYKFIGNINRRNGRLEDRERINYLNLLEQQRLVLSQFKKIHENRGDIVIAMEYLAQELETYREYLIIDRVSHPFMSKEWRYNVAERVNLWFNKISSNYGNDWLRATFVTLIINWILYSCFCWSLGFRLGGDVGKFGELFSYSFEFLNPLRKADFLNSDLHISSNVLSRVIDYISRIFIAYFVYQTIQAFRKFGKKST